MQSLEVQASPLTVTPVRVTPRRQWQFFGPKRISLYWKSLDIVTFVYNDTFLPSQHCHCKQGGLYCILLRFWCHFQYENSAKLHKWVRSTVLKCPKIAAKTQQKALLIINELTSGRLRGNILRSKEKHFWPSLSSHGASFHHEVLTRSNDRARIMLGSPTCLTSCRSAP